MSTSVLVVLLFVFAIVAYLVINYILNVGIHKGVDKFQELNARNKKDDPSNKAERLADQYQHQTKDQNQK